jgi:hypothetical protein
VIAASAIELFAANFSIDDAFAYTPCGGSGGYWLQRIIPQADFRLGPHFRFYLSFQSELERGRNGGPRPMIDEDDFDPHEAFLDISTDTEAKQSLTLRSGRQELVYGAGRLLDDNEGVNVKSSFDGIRLIAKNEWARVDAFAVKPTNLNTGILDDGPSRTQTLWGVYATLPFPILANGQADIYYIGLDTTRASYENNSGREIRETNGARLFNHEAGTPYEGGFNYNWEFIYQWGSLANNSINAFGIGTETGYTFNTWLKPRVGLIADAISGGNNSIRERSTRLIRSSLAGLTSPITWPSSALTISSTFIRP